MRTDPLWQLTLARLRMFFREPSAVFWTFGFPLALSLALGVAFRNKPPDPVAVGVWSGPDASGSRRVVEALRGTNGIEVREYYGPSTRDLSTGKIALFVRPGERLEYDFDPTRPESRLAREMVDNALQRASGRADVLPGCNIRPVSGPYVNIACFAFPQNGTFGNANRALFRKPGSWDVDGAIYKYFPIYKERARLRINGVFSNAFNHPTWNTVGNDITVPGAFGKLTGQGSFGPQHHGLGDDRLDDLSH